MLNLLKQERIDAAGGKHLFVSCVIRGNTRWRPSSADKCTHIVTVSLFFVLRWVRLSSLPSGATENPALLHLVSEEEHTKTHKKNTRRSGNCQISHCALGGVELQCATSS